MPEMPAQQRAQGGRAFNVRDPHDGDPCTCDWTTPKTAAELMHRQLPTRDQSRYGPPGTTDGYVRGQHSNKRGRTK